MIEQGGIKEGQHTLLVFLRVRENAADMARVGQLPQLRGGAGVLT